MLDSIFVCMDHGIAHTVVAAITHVHMHFTNLVAVSTDVSQCGTPKTLENVPSDPSLRSVLSCLERE